MVDWSLIIAVLMVALLGGALTGAVSLAIGGLGVTRALARRLSEMEYRSEKADERLTKEVKQRAGLASASKRTDADVKREAEAELFANPQPHASHRPSVVQTGR